MLRRIDHIIRELDPVLLIGISLFILSLVFGVSGYIRIHGQFDLVIFLEDFYANISAELGSIAITVVIVDQFARRRDKHEAEDNEKQNLIIQMRISDSVTAQNILNYLRNKDWSYVLQGADLWGAKLSEVDLSKLDLQETNFTGANLSNANLETSKLQSSNLSYANLHDSNLSSTKLQGANLHNTSLKNANLENAEFDKYTVLPDAQIYHQRGMRLPYTKYWTAETDMSRFTDPEHPEFWQPDWVNEKGI